MARKNVATTLDESLYKDVRRLALETNKNANDLIEEGMQLVLNKYKKNDNGELITVYVKDLSSEV